ncbi:hypothetical protein GCM10009839_90020 [Catenulispora yoronensis]|uniref:DUF4236 domain-containing protein n=1 Tax=Catenulispora yoronensis TaxID=450799 RepID=A0ABP5H481_9ACTN
MRPDKSDGAPASPTTFTTGRPLLTFPELGLRFRSFRRFGGRSQSRRSGGVKARISRGTSLKGRLDTAWAV